MESSRFSRAFVASGTKVFGSIRPEVTAVTTKDKFVINDKALRMMGLKAGDRIAMFDMWNGKEDSPKQEERFFVTKGFVVAGQETGALIGKGGTFSYSGVYSAILLGDETVQNCTVDDLVRNGKGIVRGKTRFIATEKVRMEVSPIGEFEPAEGVEPQEFFALKNFERDEHDPKSVNVDNDEDEDQEDETSEEVETEALEDLDI